MVVEYSREEELEKLVRELKTVKSSDWEFHDVNRPVYSTGKGLNRKVVEDLEIKVSSSPTSFMYFLSSA